MDLLAPPPSAQDPCALFGLMKTCGVDDLQSADFQTRIRGSTQLLDQIRDNGAENVEISQFLSFLEPYMTDINLSVAQNCSMIVTSIIRSLEMSSSRYLSCFTKMALIQFGDTRHFVADLGRSIISDISSFMPPTSVITDLISGSSTFSSRITAEILTSISSLLSQGLIQPSDLEQFSLFINSALDSSSSTVRISAESLIRFHPGVFKHASPSRNSSVPRKTASVVAISLGKTDISQFSRTMPIQRAQSRRASLPMSETFDTVYSVGEDIQFEPLPTVEKTIIRKPLLRPPKKPNSAPPPQLVSIEPILKALRSPEWSEQNSAILDLSNSLDQLKPQIECNLREVCSLLSECSTSLRSLLSKNALLCLSKILKCPKFKFDTVAELTAKSLLQLLPSSHQFISELSGDCFLSLIGGLSPDKAAEILISQSMSKHASIRAKVACAMSIIISTVSESAKLIQPLQRLSKDANPDVRRFAKEALGSVL